MDEIPRLTLATVRTIAAKGNGTDRTTVKHYERIHPDRARMKIWLAKKRRRDALPKRMHELSNASDELRKEAKGLGRT